MLCFVNDEYIYSIESCEIFFIVIVIVQRANTSANKQLDYLLERQKLFRQAALEAKKNGDIQQAKEYLRMSKVGHYKN